LPSRFFTLNLGTDVGQITYSLAMIMLSMVPLFIIIAQLGNKLAVFKADEQDLTV
jgi:hypothetical protein